MLPVFQAGQGIGLDLVIAPNPNRYMSMAAVRGDMDMVDFDREKARIGHFEADEFDQFFPHRFGYSPDSPFVHIRRML